MSLENVLTTLVRKTSTLEKQVAENNRLITNAPLHAGKRKDTTIEGGVITATRPHIQLAPETGTTDNLDVINNFADGKFVILSLRDSGDVITIRDYTIAGGSANIDLRGVNIVLDTVNQNIFLYYVESTDLWHLIGSPSGSIGFDADTLDGYDSLDLLARANHTGTQLAATISDFDAAVDVALATELTKLGTIATGAEVNVNADWNSVAGDSQILNKPTITAYALTFLDDANIAAAQATLALTPGTDIQAYDATLLSIALLGTAADKMLYSTGVDTWAELATLAYGRSVLNTTDSAAARTLFGLVIGTDVQAQDAELAAIAGLTSAADRLPYFTGLGTASLATFTAYGRTLIALADAAALRANINVEDGADVTDAANIASSVHGATLDAAPLDADEVPGLDSSNSFSLVRWTWTTIKEFLKTYFDTLYVALSGNQNVAGIKTFTDGISAASIATGSATLPAAGRIENVNAAANAVIKTTGNGFQGLQVIESFRANVAQSLMQLLGSRGTIASPVISNINDIVGRVIFYCNTVTGTYTPENIASIQAVVAGTPTATSAPGILTFATTPIGSLVLVAALVISEEQNTGIGTTPASSVRLHVLQPTLGNVVMRLQSTAANDDANLDTIQHKVTTTNATPTTLLTIPLAASRTYMITAEVIARRTGGVAGTTDDGAAYYKKSAYTTKAGVVTILPAAAGSNFIESADREDVVAWDCQLVISGTNVLVQVTGVTNTNISWALLKAEVSYVGT